MSKRSSETFRDAWCLPLSCYTPDSTADWKLCSFNSPKHVYWKQRSSNANKTRHLTEHASVKQDIRIKTVASDHCFSLCSSLPPLLVKGSTYNHRQNHFVLAELLCFHTESDSANCRSRSEWGCWKFPWRCCTLCSNYLNLDPVLESASSSASSRSFMFLCECMNKDAGRRGETHFVCPSF